MSNRQDASSDAEGGEPQGGRERTPLPRPGDFLAAIGLLTLVPLQRPDPRSPAFARATLFFPLVGALVGALLAGLRGVMADHVPDWLVGIIVVAAWEALSRKEWSGSTGDGATILILALTKVVGLSTAGGAQPAAVLFAPLLARWSIVVLATGARAAGSPGRKFNSAITFREFALTSVFTFAVVFAVAEAFGILIVVCVAGLTLAVRVLVHRWTAGVSWHLLLRTVQGIETFVVLVFALL